MAVAERSPPHEGASPRPQFDTQPDSATGDSPSGALEPAPHRFGRPSTHPRLTRAFRFLRDHAPTLLLGLLTGASVPAAWLGGIYRTGGPATLALLAQGALFNAFLLVLFLDLRERAQRRRRSLERLQRELRYFRTWSGEEGILRKVGLIRDLNALGAVPEDLQQAALPGADLSGAQLQGAPLREADLRGANLQGVRLDGADLWGADLAGANLTFATLTGTNFRGCNLRDAVLSKADLAGANLHRADLVNANVEGVELGTSRLKRARFAAGREFHESIHPSVEDWIRERLDSRGFYTGAPAEGRKPESERPRRRAGGAQGGRG